MFFREDEAQIYENGVRQGRRTWRCAVISACFMGTIDGRGCVERVVIMPTLNPPDSCLRLNKFFSLATWRSRQMRSCLEVLRLGTSLLVVLCLKRDFSGKYFIVALQPLCEDKEFLG